MASLTTKHLTALMIINAACVTVGIERHTVDFLKSLGLVHDRQGQFKTTLKGQDIIKQALNEANLSIVRHADSDRAESLRLAS